MGERCTVKGCNEEDARFSVLIRVWPEGCQKLTERKSFCYFMDLNLCTNHARRVGEEAILSDVEWEDVCKGLMDLGCPVPSRRTAQIEIISTLYTHHEDQIH